jgi:hypothetical protein
VKSRTFKNPCQENKKSRYCNAELVFNSAALPLGDREAADLYTKSALCRIHPDKNRRDVCATRGLPNHCPLAYCT